MKIARHTTFEKERKLMKTFAVIGLGRFGMAVATELFNMGYEVLALDKNMDLVNSVADFVTRAVCGDAKEESTLKALGIRNYDCVIVAIGGDITDSVLVTLMLKEAGIKRIVCKAMNNQHKKVLQKIGADSIIIPEQEAGIKAAVGLVSNNIVDIINLSDKYSIADIAIPNDWVGKTIAEIGVREKHSVNIVAVKDKENSEEINVTPSANYVFKKSNIAVIIGTTQAINEITRI